ncbi:MAG: hypothetical protein HOI08_04190 [Flavobacteriaceae bacterium]|jgi:hypothetical protein|nr:hypothetical protein [Flavobacteriaceae bacterium]MBT6353349.1 hypothetical protein [Pelagibacteraceae bacterium]
MDNNIFNNSQSLKLNDKSKSLVNQFNYNYNLIKEQIGKGDNLHSELSKIYDQIFSNVLNLSNSLEQTVFFNELKDYGKNLLNEDLHHFKTRDKFFKETSKLDDEKYLKGRISFLGRLLLKLIFLSITPKLRNNVKKGKYKREDLSVNSGIRIFLMTLILNLEFRNKGILKELSIYKKKRLIVSGLSLELSIPSNWWEDKDAIKTPRTSYMHFDESISNPKSIMYLSKVNKNNGPFSMLVDSKNIINPSPIQFLLGRVIGKVGREKSKISHLFNHKYHQTLGCNVFRSYFDKIPAELKFNSHFGFDIEKNSKIESKLIKNEKVLYGDFGDFFIFDGSETLHRGGLIKQGDRLVFQIIFGEYKRNYILKKIINKISKKN